jgi:8-oxo-dGTP pyrophosphatase MutT (NUDIX family)
VDGWDHAHVAARLAALRGTAAPSEPPARRAAVAIALELGGPPRVLLMRRVRQPRDPWSGQISLPGGGREPEDADLLATALRETREELGVDLARDARLLGALAPRAARARGKVLAMDVSPFVFALDRAVTPALGAEAEEAFWLPLDRVLRGELDDVYAYRRDDGTALELPAWRFEERVVWGMTHHILCDLIAAVRD